MIFDKRFLTIHPATALWFEQREKCRVCKHCWVSPLTNADGSRKVSGGGWYCTEESSVKRVVRQTCSDARATDQPCGPDGLLFQPKTENDK